MRTVYVVALVCLTGGLLQAATMPLSESFTGGSQPAGFTEANTSSPDRDIYYTESGVAFDRGENADSGRNYVRTADTDYHVIGFTAEITVTASVGDGEYGNSSQFYFGLGPGEVGKYGVPDRPDGSSDTNDSLVFILNKSNDSTADRLVIATADDGAWSEEVVLGDYPASVSTYTHRIRMEYDALGTQARFSVDFDYGSGLFATDLSSDWKNVSGLADSTGWGGGEPASIFFGGDSDDGDNPDLPTLARDLIITPEPATLALLGLGGLGVALRRRRVTS